MNKYRISSVLLASALFVIGLAPLVLSMFHSYATSIYFLGLPLIVGPLGIYGCLTKYHKYLYAYQICLVFLMITGLIITFANVVLAKYFDLHYYFYAAYEFFSLCIEASAFLLLNKFSWKLYRSNLQLTEPLVEHRLMV